MAAAKSNAERSADYRARLKEQGGKETLIRFDADAVKAVDSITGRTGETHSEAVCRAVKKLDQEESADRK